MNWLEHVPTCSTVYVYQAALVCEDCALKIMAKLDRPGHGDRGFADDGDSDNYPQGPHSNGGGESDNAQFCDSGRGCVNAVKIAGRKIGCPLGNPLTSEGVASVRRSICENLISTKRDSRLIGRLLHYVWKDWVSAQTPFLAQSLKDVPPTLASLIHTYLRKSPEPATIEPRIFCDVEHAYLIGHHGSRVDLLRFPTNDIGDFTKTEISSTSVGAAEGVPIQDLISEAIDEGAWD